MLAQTSFWTSPAAMLTETDSSAERFKKLLKHSSHFTRRPGLPQMFWPQLQCLGRHTSFTNGRTQLHGLALLADGPHFCGREPVIPTDPKIPRDQRLDGPKKCPALDGVVAHAIASTLSTCLLSGGGHPPSRARVGCAAIAVGHGRELSSRCLARSRHRLIWQRGSIDDRY